ncbi:MAG: hypothetical protein JXP34_09710, partial [Planctomycetes bacterium]|nr:hypothetical protein [Planctomycetota bacterium]
IRARARCVDGSGWTAELRHVRHGDKWLAAGYRKVTTGWGLRTEEDRRDEYADAGGIPVLQRVAIRTSFHSIAGLISTRQDFAFRDWRIRKRAQPLPALGADPDENPSPPPPAPARRTLLSPTPCDPPRA